MEADFELGENGELRDTQTGYPHRARSGSATGHVDPRNGGRPRGYSPTKAAELQALFDDEKDEGDDADRMSTAVKKAVAQARKETALADLNELEFQVKSKQYLPRAAYQEATATLLASLSQALRSIPDTLERKLSLQPEALEMIATVIDESLNQVASTLALFTET